ncbi:MAG: D-alanyl-D-alanine carboxypeptidase/D-alanyl-D-alanine-endopeptidase (penicillin-binding protein 4) [Bacteriovoracaceae bacterium]|jgi:D-alanyl-D-alanine carboxypeptidase/D-alanyl-D-alanine-endopeptidase (penicillin-binding protein 4)
MKPAHFIRAILAVSILSVSAPSYSGPMFKRLVKEYKIGKYEDQSFCYIDGAGNLKGNNPQIKIRLASVSKIYTSFWALSRLGPDYQYETKFYVKDKKMHIVGSKDPIFDDRKVFYLLSQFNELGIKKLDKITFDKNLLVFPNKKNASEDNSHTTSDYQKYLNTYFNTKKWSEGYYDEYLRLRRIAPQNNDQIELIEKPEFKVSKIEFSEEAPFDLEGSDVTTYSIKSLPLYKYLKFVNIVSNNYIPEKLFEQLSEKEDVNDFLDEAIGIDREKIKLYTGSGLMSYDDEGTRFDNYSTCEMTIKMMIELKKMVEANGLFIHDVMAVPGADGGTFRRRRFSIPELTNAFVAKTGTLYHTVALAGMLSTNIGLRYFGIFNQTEEIWSARKLQDEIVLQLFKDFQGPVKFPYRKEGFWPAAGPLEVINESSPSALVEVM